MEHVFWGTAGGTERKRQYNVQKIRFWQYCQLFEFLDFQESSSCPTIGELPCCSLLARSCVLAGGARSLHVMVTAAEKGQFNGHARFKVVNHTKERVYDVVKEASALLRVI